MTYITENIDEDKLRNITYENRSFPKPAHHGIRGSINIDQLNLYQTVRKKYKNEQSIDNESPILTKDYTDDFLDTPHAVQIKESNWKAGSVDTNGEYVPEQKYNITIRPKDENNNVVNKTPIKSLSICIIPQTDSLVYHDGHKLQLPYGVGTRIQITTTGANSPQQILDRVDSLLVNIFSYSLDDCSVIDESKTFSRMELYHRIDRELVDLVTDSLKKNGKIIYQKEKENKYLTYRVESPEWDKLGFGDFEYNAEIKIYDTKYYHESSNPLAHPKVEISLKRSNSKNLPHFDDWNKIQNKLISILNTNLLWAKVEPNDLIADDLYDGIKQPISDWEHPVNARQPLQYSQKESVRDKMASVVMNRQTRAPYDILLSIERLGMPTYDDIAKETGLTKATVGRYARRFEKMGFCKVIRSQCAFVDFANKCVRKIFVSLILDHFDTDDYQNKTGRATKRERNRRNLISDLPYPIGIKTKIDIGVIDTVIRSYRDLKIG